MIPITIKQISTDLFGVVDAEDPEAFRSVFSAPDHPVRTVSIDDTVLDQVANSLGIQLKRIGEDLSDFVRGDYHLKADAPTGTQMGNVTEALSYLLLRSDGTAVTRVESYERGDGKGDFPQPDFLLEENGQLGALEVKSTQALDFLALDEVVRSSNKRRGKQLGPCAHVAWRRAEALRQLGYDGDSPQPQLHRLVLRDERVMAFPSDFGIVDVHLVRDGRLGRIRGHENSRRARTLPACAAQERTCWTCLDARKGDPQHATPPEPAHIALVTMHNEPGSLGLLAAGEHGAAWRRAYARWTEALWARDPRAASEMQVTLVDATQAWIEELTAAERDAAPLLRGAWDQYLGGLAFRRGLRELARRPRFGQAELQDGFEPRDSRPGDEPEVALLQQLPPRWLAQEQPTRVHLGRGQNTFSLYADREFFEVRLLSPWWWQAREMNAESAAQIAEDLLVVAWEATGGPDGITFSVQGTLQEASAHVEPARTAQISIGWHLVSSGDWRTILARQRPQHEGAFTTPWLLGLTLGDPRCKLFIHRDGRGYLQLARSLSVPETRPISTTG